MKIYTYYNDIGFNRQKEILALWCESWKNKGFDPIILSSSDAESHEYYNEFNDKFLQIYKNIKHDEPSKYILACYHRWLAYATQKKELFFVSDYDVININLLPTPISSRTIHFMNGVCPCFASGRPEYFTEFIKDAIELSLTNFKSIKEKSKVIYHDQEFINCNYHLLQHKYKFTNDPILWSKVRHYYHDLLYLIKNKDLESLRIFLIQKDIETIKYAK